MRAKAAGTGRWSARALLGQMVEEAVRTLGLEQADEGQDKVDELLGQSGEPARRRDAHDAAADL